MEDYYMADFKKNVPSEIQRHIDSVCLHCMNLEYKLGIIGTSRRRGTILFSWFKFASKYSMENTPISDVVFFIVEFIHTQNVSGSPNRYVFFEICQISMLYDIFMMK